MDRIVRVFCLVVVASLVVFSVLPRAEAYDTGCFKENSALSEFLVGNGFNFDVRAKDARAAFKLDKSRKAASGTIYISTKLYDEESGSPLDTGFYKCGFYPNNGQISELHKAVNRIYTEPSRDETVRLLMNRFGSKTSCQNDPKKWYIVHKGRYLIVDLGVVRLNLWTWLVSVSARDVSREICEGICREVWKQQKSGAKRAKSDQNQESLDPLRDEIAGQFRIK